MGKQTINLGTTPTGVGGDTPRSAFTKVNSNFDELYASDAVSYKRSNLLAAVTQSGGMPTGGAMEKITNSAGTIYKYANGMMITTQEVVGYTALVEKSITFPAAFTGNSVVSCGVLPVSHWDFSFNYYSWGVGFGFMSNTTSATNKIQAVAVGRWF